MLTSLPPASPHMRPPLPPRLKRKACPERKRGGQPGNANAFRHGLYSSHSLHPHAAHFRSTSREPLNLTTLLQSPKSSWSSVLSAIMMQNLLKLRKIVSITAHNVTDAELCAWSRATTKIDGKQVQVFKALRKLSDSQEHLRCLARDLSVLLDLEFRRFGIHARQIFVPLGLNNFHANLDWEYPRLTDSQWWLLQDTFGSLHVELDSIRRRPRKPLPADRFLLEGILWKLAGGLRWQDLAGNYPVRLCQDLYRALYWSGRMQAIYQQLHWHLNIYGEAALDELVERGCFVITGNRVHLSPSEEQTWEKYTALLLLQQAFHARRVIQREADLERRRRGLFLRLPSLRY